MAKNVNMTAGHPGRLLIFFALPLMFGNVFQQLYTVVDTAIVGRGVGMDALAALGTVDWLNWVFLGIAQGFTQGFSVRMAQKYGQGDLPGLKQAVGVSARLCVGIAAVSLLVAQLGLPLFMKLLQVPSDLKPMAELYSRIVMGGIPALVFYNYCSATLRAVGDSKTPLLAMIIASLTNIVLDCVTVFLLGWGIAGAAAATVFSQCLAGTICAVKIAKSTLLRFSKKDTAKDGELEKILMDLGAPVAIQYTVISIGGMSLQTVVNGFAKSFIAGYTATNKLYGILEIAASSYGHAVTSYTGQNFGAGNWERIRKGVRWAVGISLVTSTVISAVMIFFGREITMLFISREDATLALAAGNTAYHYLCVMSAALPMLYLLYTYRAALEGMGKTNLSLLSGIVEFCIRVGGAMIVGGFALAQQGIFYAEVGAWIGAAILLFTAYCIHVRKLGK